MINKNILKKIRIVYFINSRIKEFLHIYYWKKLQSKFHKKTIEYDYIYDENEIINEVKLKITKKSIGTKKLNIIWVGTDESQDKSGFTQALEKLFNVHYFYNSKGKYGLNNIDKKGNKISFNNEVADDNGKQLVEFFYKLNSINRIDLIFGQMMANYISKDSLKILYEKRIPILNLSMDDKLPINWDKKNNRLLGAIGISDYVDLTLTTTPEVCKWYFNYGKNAIFMPLGSNKGLYKNVDKTDRIIDVLFIGNNYGIRGDLISFLKGKGVNVSAWGNGFENGFADFTQSIELMKKSKIILGFSTLGYCRNEYTLKLRDFDATMSGALYLTQKNDLLSTLFCENKEIIFYSDFNDCLLKINYYLSNDSERKEISLLGHEKCRDNYDWEKILKNMLNNIGIDA